MKKVSKLLGRWGAVCGLVLAGLVQAGCQSGPKFTELPGVGPARGGGTATPGQPAVVGQTRSSSGSGADESREIDIFHPGDTFLVNFTDLPMPVQPIQDRVKEDGTITLLQNQTFVAAGKTRRQLETEIRARYVPNFFAAMTVQVVPAFQSQFYYVGGEVKAPGQHVYLSRTTVLQAIQAAGDFTDFANRRNVLLTRADGHTFRINCKKARSNPNLDLLVLPNDRIDVYRRTNPLW